MHIHIIRYVQFGDIKIVRSMIFQYPKLTKMQQLPKFNTLRTLSASLIEIMLSNSAFGTGSRHYCLEGLRVTYMLWVCSVASTWLGFSSSVWKHSIRCPPKIESQSLLRRLAHAECKSIAMQEPNRTGNRLERLSFSQIGKANGQVFAEKRTPFLQF